MRLLRIDNEIFCADIKGHEPVAVFTDSLIESAKDHFINDFNFSEKIIKILHDKMGTESAHDVSELYDAILMYKREWSKARFYISRRDYSKLEKQK